VTSVQAIKKTTRSRQAAGRLILNQRLHRVTDTMRKMPASKATLPEKTST